MYLLAIIFFSKKLKLSNLETDLDFFHLALTVFYQPDNQNNSDKYWFLLSEL